MKYSLMTLLGLSSAALFGAQHGCAPEAPANCNPDDCCRTYCLGPANYGVNPPVNPVTCNGDWVIEVAGFYWNAHQEGLEYAIDNQMTRDDFLNDDTGGRYINADFESPDFKWDFGFKLGLGFNTTCDGWDLGVNWTWYKGKASSHVEAEQDDNHILLSLWSNLGVEEINYPIATDIETHWTLRLNLVDVELGREFWNSKRLALRPFVGVRFASIKQNYDIQHKGGDFTNNVPDPFDDPVNDEVDMDNDFKGVGLRGGLNSVWNLGCGWSIYGDLAVSIVYGRFDIDHDEQIRQAQSPFSKLKLTEVNSSFRASRFMTDLALGIQWSSLFCDCQYGLTVALGWENHMFLNQNQLWRFVHETDSIDPIISQTRGDLDTQGVTLSVKFEF